MGYAEQELFKYKKESFNILCFFSFHKWKAIPESDGGYRYKCGRCGKNHRFE